MGFNVEGDTQPIALSFKFDNEKECLMFLRHFRRIPDAKFYRMIRVTPTQILFECDCAVVAYRIGVESAAMWCVPNVVIFHPDK